MSILEIENKKPEDITSRKYLDKSLENAKIWCQNNLQKYLPGFTDEIDYNIFSYMIDNKMIGPDMRLDEKQQGLIRVSTEKIKWLQEREEIYKKDELYKMLREPVEVDIESMFVHEITEWIILKKLDLLKFPGYISNAVGAHPFAREMENNNRREHGLKDWPEY